MKRIPPSLLALGRVSAPSTLTLDGRTYRFRLFFKHDFFAATALYESDQDKVVVKFGRQADILGFPTQWIGQLLAWREASAYARLSDLETVPRFRGRWGPTAIIHDYVEGRPLARNMTVPDDFFSHLHAAIDTLHERRMAYVDLEKRQNVLVGDDGRPYLIDFQIAWLWPIRFASDSLPVRWLRNRFQEGDRYHLLKLQRRVRPDQLTPEEILRSYRKPGWVRFHRFLAAPYQWLRRPVLNRLDPKRRGKERGAT